MTCLAEPVDQGNVALRAIAEGFPGFFEANTSVMLLVEPLSGAIVAANASAAAFYGYPRPALEGMNITEINILPRALVADERMQALKEDRKYFLFPHRLASGEVREVEVYSTPVQLAGRTLLLSIIHDLSERRKAEKDLLEKSQFLELLINHIPNQVFWKDRDLNFRGCNNTFAAVVGLAEPSQVVGTTDFEIARSRQEAEAYRNLDRQVMASGEAVLNLEERFHAADGSEGSMLISKIPIRDMQNQVLGVLGVGVDITDLRRAEEENAKLQARLQQAQNMESLGGLAGGVAHDMNNVLGAILGLASAHLALQPEGSSTHKAFRIICEAATRGADLVKNLLAFARRSPCEKRSLDLNALILEEARLLEPSLPAGIRLELDLAPGLRPILGDGNTLACALRNLCVNAVEAMPEGGALALSSRNLGEDRVEVAVVDSGCGMAREVLDRAMDPFFTTKDLGKGTGLGLSLVYTAMMAHDGQVAIQSKPGRGTQVVLRLPQLHLRSGS